MTTQTSLYIDQKTDDDLFDLATDLIPGEYVEALEDIEVHSPEFVMAFFDTVMYPNVCDALVINTVTKTWREASNEDLAA